MILIPSREPLLPLHLAMYHCRRSRVLHCWLGCKVERCELGVIGARKGTNMVNDVKMNEIMWNSRYC